MSSEYRNNHYVPVWYQKRFLPKDAKENELYYLKLKPKVYYDAKGKAHYEKTLKKLGFKHCFAEYDLYSTTFESEYQTEIEQFFFGKIDKNGNRAVKYFTDFSHPSVNGNAFNDLILFMSTQKLRTPKGLGYISQSLKTLTKNHLLRYMIQLRRLYCAIWTECIWQIADATCSETKFIISDHPVTVYNKRCGPRSHWCRGFKDPDIWLHGTHTFFPLSIEKILILTNLSWVRNPYQSPVGLRPNPNPMRNAMFKFSDIQTLRYLDEQEVREINFIIKSRALNYIAAGKEDWLYPDKYISKSQWNTYGHGYLLMPDPRPVHLGGGVLWGNEDGSSGAIDEYGRRPWEKDYGKEDKSLSEYKTLYRFKGEFAELFGPKRRGRTYNFMKLDDEFDTEDFHNYHLSYLKKKKRRI